MLCMEQASDFRKELVTGQKKTNDMKHFQEQVEKLIGREAKHQQDARFAAHVLTSPYPSNPSKCSQYWLSRMWWKLMGLLTARTRVNQEVPSIWEAVILYRCVCLWMFWCWSVTKQLALSQVALSAEDYTWKDTMHKCVAPTCHSKAGPHKPAFINQTNLLEILLDHL